MGGRSESDYREVAFEREGKDPLHGFMRVDRGMVIVRGYGGHKETPVSSSPPDFIARLLLSELERRPRAEKRTKKQRKRRTRSPLDPSMSSTFRRQPGSRGPHPFTTNHLGESTVRHALYLTIGSAFSGGAIENTNQVFQPEDRF